ncbi:hypothetical protein [Aliivibrio fischeri]|uniref:hypothetical protein n=1 Tax=Aliivibrio fischeri TaxID=668 RepID=UPI0007C5BC2E|nr:hypothetical protein [Aliivibrio fischeri]
MFDSILDGVNSVVGCITDTVGSIVDSVGNVADKVTGSADKVTGAVDSVGTTQTTVDKNSGSSNAMSDDAKKMIVYGVGGVVILGLGYFLLKSK